MVGSQFCPILNKHSQNCQRILQILVTLILQSSWKEIEEEREIGSNIEKEFEDL